MVESWTTGEEHLIECVPVGAYTLHEEAAVDGYIVANDVEFTVEEMGEIQKVKMEDERAMGQLVIVKTDTDSKAALEGMNLFCWKREPEGYETFERLEKMEKQFQNYFQLELCGMVFSKNRSPMC